MTDQFTPDDLSNLTPAQAEALYEQGKEAVVWALLQLAALARQKGAAPGAANAADPSTPSAMIAPYDKPASSRRKAKPGRKDGHEGVRRRPPLRIDRRVSHTLERCPECGGPVHPPNPKPRTRVIEDIEASRPVATEHTIFSHYCPRCRKRVEPVVTDALPRATIGNRTLALTSWLHYGLGNTVSQVASVLDNVFHFSVSDGGLTGMWRRLADALAPWYAQIAAQARGAAVLNADETGWRVNGKTHWLWCFTHPTLTYYTIDESRSSAVLKEFFGETFAGTLVTDFYGAYNCLMSARRQVCFAHLLREIKKVSLKNESDEWVVLFAGALKKLLKDALRLGRRAERDAPDFQSKRARIHKRLDEFRDGVYTDPDAARLVKRLTQYREALFSFLDDAAVPPDNNRAERELRPAVIARKNSFHNMSDAGARTQAVLMSVYRTLKLRGHDPVETLAAALASHIGTGRLPPLPAATPPAAAPTV